MANIALGKILGVASTISICALSAVVDYVLFNQSITQSSGHKNSALWWGVIMIVLILLNLIYNWKAILNRNRDLRERLSLLVANTCSGNYVDIALVFTFLIYTAQISATVNDVIVNGHSVLRPIIYTFALGISVFQKPIFLQERRENSHKVLITGLSKIAYSERDGNGSFNIEPTILPVNRFDSSVELVVVLVAAESYKRLKMPVAAPKPEEIGDKGTVYNVIMSYSNDEKEKYTDEELMEIIRKLCDKPNLKIVFSPTVDFNNFNDCNKAVMNQVQQVLADKEYDDCDLMFNITPGTKMLSVAMTINAIKGERTIVYISQDSSDNSLETRVKEYNPNVEDQYEQFKEIVMEISERNSK